MSKPVHLFEQSIHREGEHNSTEQYSRNSSKDIKNLYEKEVLTMQEVSLLKQQYLQRRYSSDTEVSSAGGTLRLQI